jgi:hypothetical protein
MMRWFERHLNWAALALFIGSILGLLFFTRVSFRINFIGWDFPFGYGFPIILLLALFVTVWFILNAIGYGGILFKKKRSPLFLFFFIPAFLTIIGSLGYKLFFFSTIDFYVAYPNVSEPIIRPPIYLFIILFNTVVFISGWIVLLSLRNRNRLDLDQNPFTKMSQNRFFSYLYSSGTRFKYILLSVSSCFVIFSLISFFFTTLGYLTYNLPKSLSSEFPEISFKYPAKYLEPVYHKVKNFNKDLFVSYINLYYIRGGYTDSDIQIRFSIPSDNQTHENYMDTIGNNLLKEYSNPPEYQRVSFSTARVGDITARKFAVSVEKEFINEIDWNDFGSHIYVYFEHRGRYWIIEYNSRDRVTLTSPGYFTHLLESFRFIRD